MSKLFSNYTNADITDLIAAYPLALLVTDGPGGFAATPLPMLAETDDKGQLTKLLGHMALSNPQLDELRASARCYFLFQGPNSYISPRFVPNRNWGPTWNYALVKVEARLELRPDLNDLALSRLVAYLEEGQPDAWSIGELGERYGQLSRHIVAFEAHVQSVDGRFKLGQDEKPEVYRSILEKVDNPPLVDWMQRLNRHRPPD